MAVRAFHWIITTMINMFKLATGYLTVTDAVSSFSFLKAHLAVAEKMLLCFTRVKLL